MKSASLHNFFGLVPREGLFITHDIVMLHEQNEVLQKRSTLTIFLK
jgi:hypothetical protein